jgi:osmoprotectant transport system permease protein
MNDFVDAFQFIGNNLGLLGTKTLETLWLSARAIVIAAVIALPLGVWLGHHHRGSFVAINISNIGRALPSLAIIAICLAFIGLGDTNTIIALVVLAIPPMLTNAYVGVDTVDRDAVEAARGMGMTGFQILRHVELPLAIALIFAGLRTSAVFVVATSPLAAVAGGNGLGEIIVNQASYGFGGVLAGAICIALLAFLTELAFAALQRAVTPRGLRSRRRVLPFARGRRGGAGRIQPGGTTA